jgi:hypothetical protein
MANAKKWCGNPPSTCDLCSRSIKNAFVDGVVGGVGSWACMCLTCHSLSGVGLGTGKGQQYELISDLDSKAQSWIKVQG